MFWEVRYVDSLAIFQLLFNILHSKRASKHYKYARDKHPSNWERYCYLKIQVREVNLIFCIMNLF